MNARWTDAADVYTWDIGNVRLEVGCDDLLAADVDAIVNSEQTDFVLAWDERTVSGQLRRACPGMQEELDLHFGTVRDAHAPTVGAPHRRPALPPGTVLETAGPRGRVFHAGFHKPDEWLDPTETDAVAAHAAAIRHCVDDILRRVRARRIPSVAFPSIGTGRFRLPRATFARLFFDCVGALGIQAGPRLDVLLCLRDREAVDVAVREGTRALVALLGGGEPLLPPAGGHPLLAALRAEVRSSSDPFAEAWRLLRFTELALQVDLAVAWEFADAPLDQLTSSVAGNGRTPRFTFGLIRNRLEGNLDASGGPDWLRRRLDFLRREASRAAIARLVDDRNAYAHHRPLRDGRDMLRDVDALFGPTALPAPWPRLRGRQRWLRDDDAQTWLLESVDVDRGLTGWVQPVTRAFEERPLQHA